MSKTIILFHTLDCEPSLLIAQVMGAGQERQQLLVIAAAFVSPLAHTAAMRKSFWVVWIREVQ